MKVTFITHSCYFVETEDFFLLFDYYEGRLPEVDRTKPLYAFSSHSHGDHFSEKLFDAVKDFEQVSFILSSDIFRSRIPAEYMGKTMFVMPERSYEAGVLKISTLTSTDAGVAFLIEGGGRLFYHAGDLNCWVWDGAPAGQNEMMERKYDSQMKKLYGMDIYIAFVPLDPRQGDDYYRGMAGFLKNTRAEYIFPMHMWGDFSVTERFMSKPEFRDYLPCFMPVTSEGQSFELT